MNLQIGMLVVLDNGAVGLILAVIKKENLIIRRRYRKAVTFKADLFYAFSLGNTILISESIVKEVHHETPDDQRNS